MNIKKFLHDHWLHILGWISGLIFLDVILWLDPRTHITLTNLVYVNLLLTAFFIIFLVGLFFLHQRWYRAIDQRIAAKADGLNLPLTEAHNEEQRQIQFYVNQLQHYHQQDLNQLIASQQDQKAFIDSWVHEIKVPLAATRLTIETVSDDLPEAKAEILEQQLQKINHYVEQVLYYSRLDSFSRDYLIQEYDLKPLVKDMIRDFRDGFIQNHLQFELQGDNQTVLTDAKWLRFILEQLLSNSLKYTPAGGKITIGLKRDEKGVWLFLKDTGIGIPLEDQSRVFDKGFTGQNGRKANQHATGLGLYLAKQLSHKLGHEITVVSKVGQGSTFSLLFPFLSYYNEKAGDDLHVDQIAR